MCGQRAGCSSRQLGLLISIFFCFHLHKHCVKGSVPDTLQESERALTNKGCVFKWWSLYEQCALSARPGQDHIPVARWGWKMREEIDLQYICRLYRYLKTGHWNYSIHGVLLSDIKYQRGPLGPLRLYPWPGHFKLQLGPKSQDIIWTEVLIRRLILLLSRFRKTHLNCKTTCEINIDWYYVCFQIQKHEDYSPVHKDRKFLLVLGQMSEKSWNTMRPTAKNKGHFRISACGPRLR